MRNLALCTLLFAAASIQTVSAEVWRCDGDLFTSSLTDPSGTEYSRCERFNGSQVCGEGRNRFITPARSGLRTNLLECSGEDQISSPLVEEATLSKVARGEKSPINFERKFARPESSSKSELLPSGSLEQLEQILPMVEEMFGPGVGEILKNSETRR